MGGARERGQGGSTFGLAELTAAQRALLGAVLAACRPGNEPALVGGVIRDRRLGLPPARDLDVAVSRGALAVGRRLATLLHGVLVPLDVERGAARVVAGEGQVDLSELRAPTLAGDLALRDYTVNALAAPLHPLLRTGRVPLVDPTGGLADLRARRLRPAGPGVLDDDPLRALRGIRLAATLGLRLTPAAGRAIARAAPALTRVAAERVRDELQALLAARYTARALRRADRLGVLAAVLPEVEAMRRTPQPRPHRFAVLEHSLRAVAGADAVLARPWRLAPFGEELAAHLAQPLGGGVTRGQVVKLAALLHDVAKPETRRRVGPAIRFFEHDVRGAERARVIGERLRLPAAATALLAGLVRHHLRPMHLAGAGELTERARYRFYRDLGPDTRDLIVLALVDAAAVRGQSPFVLWPRADLLRDLLRGFMVQQRMAAAPPLLRGEDVMARYGLAPGPAVGHLLRVAREAQDRGLVRSREQALAYLDSAEPGRIE
jgi:putative nucleotidyltransferase with HDIG domain